MTNTTRPANAPTSDDDPTPIRSPFKRPKKNEAVSLFAFEPLFYIKQIHSKHPDLPFETLLEITASAGDAARVWAQNNDLLRQDWFNAVEDAVGRHLTSLRPEMVLRQNTWADDVLSRQRWWSPKVTFVMKNMPCSLSEAEELILAGLNKRCPPDAPLRSKDDLYKFPGSADAASGAVTDEMKARKEQMAKTIPQWTKDHDEKLAREAGLFSILPSQIDTMVMDTLHMSIRDANKDMHPDRIMATIKVGIPGWAKQWIVAPPVQATLPLGGEVEVKDEIPEEDDDDELTKALATNLQRLASKSTAPVVEEVSAVIPATVANSPMSKGAAALDAILGQSSEKPAVEPAVPAEPTAPLTTTVDAAETRIELSEEEEADGKPYTYKAIWTPGQWQVSFKTWAIFTDAQKQAIEKDTERYLHLTNPDKLIVDWAKDTVPAALAKECRDKLDRLIRDGWPEWDADTPIAIDYRVKKLQEILEVQTSAEALQSLGYEATVKKVFEAVSAKQEADKKALTVRQEEDRKRFDEQQQQKALVPVNQAVANVPNGVLVMPPASPIKLPSPAEQTFMDKCAELAVKCLIYPNVAAAFLAIYTGFDMGFGIPASTRLIYAFVGKGGKINIYPSAEAYAAKCLSRQDICERFVVVNDTEESAVAIIKRRGQEQVTIRYTKEQATVAGLWNSNDKPAWKQNPKMMLKRRVSREAAVTFFPEICSDLGITKPEDDDDDTVVSVDLPMAASF